MNPSGHHDTINKHSIKLTCLERVEQEIQKLQLVLYLTPQQPLLHQNKNNREFSFNLSIFISSYRKQM